METGKVVGLAFLGAGITGLILYGLYHLIREISSVDPVILTLLALIIIGVLILLIATALDRGREKEDISEEDLRQ